MAEPSFVSLETNRLVATRTRLKCIAGWTVCGENSACNDRLVQLQLHSLSPLNCHRQLAPLSILTVPR